MIKKVDDLSYASEYAKIYNSANKLYPLDKRYPSDASAFLPLLENDVNYIYVDSKETICGFLSYHAYSSYYELTSLYVRFDKQNLGIGEQLLAKFEQGVATNELILVKALKDSPWAIKFYNKHGYVSLGLHMKPKVKELGIKEDPWSIVLYKYNSH